MTHFTLSLHKKNMKIAKAIQRANIEYVELATQGDKITVSFKEGLQISRLELSSLGIDLSDNDWATLCKEIKKTLRGGKVRDFNSLIIGIRPLKTELLTIRLSPLEKSQMLEAAKIEGESVTSFIRTAALRRVSEVFDRETAQRMVEEAKVKAEKEGAYIS